MLTSGAKTHRMCATSLAALLLLSYIFAVVAARAVEEDTGVGAPLLDCLRSIYARASDNGHGKDDLAAVITAF